MNWSMPRPVLKLVALLIGAACLGSFTLMLLTAPPRGRLPGERTTTQTVGPAINAVDATPLVAERIEGAPAPRELTEEQKARLEAERLAQAEAAAAARAAAEKAQVVVAPVLQTPEVVAPPPPPPPPPKAPPREEPVF